MDRYLSTVPDWKVFDDVTNELFEFLLSNFPAERTKQNAFSYDQKLNFWKKHILNAAMLGLFREEDCFVVKLPTLVSNFSRGKLFNGCMPVVLKHLESENKILNTKIWNEKLATFGLSSAVYGATSKVYELGKRIMNTIRSLIFPPKEETLERHVFDESYILLEFSKEISLKTTQKLSNEANTYTQRLLLVKDFVEAAEIVYTDIKKQLCGKIFTGEDLLEIFNDLYKYGNDRLSNYDIIVLLKQAQENGHLVVKNTIILSTAINKDDLINVPIKIICDNCSLKPDSEIKKITDADLNVIEIKLRRRKLMEKHEHLQKQIYDIKEMAKSSLQSKKVNLAREYLRQAKQLSNLVDTISSSLSNVFTLLNSIDSLETSRDIMDAYNYGSLGLEELRKKLNISIGTIDDCIEKCNESIQENIEIEQALQSGLNDISKDILLDSDTYDENIEKELDGLLKSAKLEENHQDETKIIDRLNVLTLQSSQVESEIFNNPQNLNNTNGESSIDEKPRKNIETPI